jgi:lipid-A-disaccharide synthase
MVVAGEPSGDALGARLLAALRQRAGDGFEAFGVGGPRMAAGGFDSLFPMEDLSVMGLAEILPRILRLKARLAETEAAARARRPDVLVTIDSPGFNLRLAGRLADARFPLVHYVAPQIWAWRQGRLRHVVPLFDRLLALLPFEPAFFEPAGLPTRFVGHPVVEYGAAGGDGAGFRARQGIAADAPLVALLPGSRRSETTRLMPVFGQVLAQVAPTVPGLVAVLPTVPAVADQVRAAVRDWPVAATVLDDPAVKYDVFAAATCALAASGTVTLELALARVPMLVCYRTSWLTAALVRRMIHVPHVCMVNVLLKEGVVPEFLQEDCRADRIVPALAGLLAGDAVAARQREAVERVAGLLGEAGPPPSMRAAEAVLEAIEAGPRPGRGTRQAT